MISKTSQGRAGLAVATCVILGLTATTAEAQFGGGFGRGGMGNGPMGRPDGPPGRPGDCNAGPPAAPPAEDYGEQLDRLHLQLGLEPRQEKAWLSYQASIEALALDQSRGRPQETTTSRATALQQLDATVDTLRNRLAALEDVTDAARVLYKLLDERQRGLADRLLAGTLPVPSIAPSPDAAGRRRESNQRGKPPLR